MDPNYEASPLEARTIFGLHLEQLRNNCQIDGNMFKNIKTEKKEVGINKDTWLVVFLGSLCRAILFYLFMAAE